MHINKINNDTNFKMALKINKKALPELEKLPIEKIKNIEEFGEKLKDLKLYNVHLNEKLCYEIRSANPEDKTDYLASLRDTEKYLGKHYSVTEYDGGGETTRGGWYPDEPPSFTNAYGKKAPEEYKRFKELDLNNQIEQYCRMLEKFELDRIAKEEAAVKAKREAEEAAQIALAEKTSTLTSMMEKFGYEEPVVEEQLVEKAEPKKNFFKRLFHLG